MFSKGFAKAALERAIRTFAQTLAAIMVADGAGLLDADWGARLSTSAGAAILSLLVSLAGDQIGRPGPSLANETTTPTPFANGGTLNGVNIEKPGNDGPV